MYVWVCLWNSDCQCLYKGLKAKEKKMSSCIKCLFYLDADDSATISIFNIELVYGTENWKIFRFLFSLISFAFSTSHRIMHSPFVSFQTSHFIVRNSVQVCKSVCACMLIYTVHKMMVLVQSHWSGMAFNVCLSNQYRYFVFMHENYHRTKDNYNIDILYSAAISFLPTAT